MISYYFYRRVASPTHISKLIPALEYGNNKMVALSKEIGMSYVTVLNCMQDALKEELIIKTDSKGNSFNFKLTAKGKALCDLCNGVKAVVENWEGDKTIKILRNLKFEFENHIEVKDDKDKIVR